ncbi:hypothetical protein D9M72_461910 [compost metagenome]
MKLGLMGDPKQITSIGALQAPAPSSRAAADLTAPVVEKPGPVRELPRADDQVVTSGGRRRRRLSKRVLIGGGVSAAVVLLGTAVAVSAVFLPAPPSPTQTSTGTAAAKQGRKCAGEERPRFSDGECNLLTTAAAHHLVAPDTCASNKDLLMASYGIICDPSSDSGFSSTERPKVSVYGYTSVGAMRGAFDKIIDQYGAAERPPERPPGWQDWVQGDQTVKGRILGVSVDGANYLVWNEEASLTEVWAGSRGADVPRLLQWWKEKW